MILTTKEEIAAAPASRELDSEVALTLNWTMVRNVMRWNTVRRCYVGRDPDDWTGLPPGKRGGPYDGDFCRIPDYTTNASHDYAVLEHVRTKWGRKYREMFCKALEYLWMRRGFDEWPFEAYQTGDYSRAALIATL